MFTPRVVGAELEIIVGFGSSSFLARMTSRVCEPRCVFVLGMLAQSFSLLERCF